MLGRVVHTTETTDGGASPPIWLLGYFVSPLAYSPPISSRSVFGRLASVELVCRHTGPAPGGVEFY